eukprot:5346705-Pyramimonas_sp.AAC.1
MKWAPELSSVSVRGSTDPGQSRSGSVGPCKILQGSTGSCTLTSVSAPLALRDPARSGALNDPHLR